MPAFGSPPGAVLRRDELKTLDCISVPRLVFMKRVEAAVGPFALLALDRCV